MILLMYMCTLASFSLKCCAIEHTHTHTHTHTGQNISLLIDITKLGKWSHAKAALVNMLRDARYKVDSYLMTLKGDIMTVHNYVTSMQLSIL